MFKEAKKFDNFLKLIKDKKEKDTYENVFLKLATEGNVAVNLLPNCTHFEAFQWKYLMKENKLLSWDPENKQLKFFSLATRNVAQIRFEKTAGHNQKAIEDFLPK